VDVRFSAPVHTGPVVHSASCTMGTESFAGVKSGRGMTLTPHPLLVPLVMKEYSYTSILPMGHTACTEFQCLYRVSVPLQSQCLYRASVPVKSLSACTESQCLYRVSVPVQSLSACTESQCLYRVLVPVQGLSACTESQCLYRVSVPVQS
jgi:hypothetical protein